MEDPTKLLLAYWAVRGRVQAIRYFLEYLGLPYEEKSIKLRNGRNGCAG